MTQKKRAIVLLSGGLDSATVVAIAQNEGYEVYALSFRYGQRHSIELSAAETIAQHLNVKEHKTATLDLRLFGGSALTDDIDVPKDAVETDEIPVTYVPARNTIFLSFALAYAEVVGAKDIFIGVNALDYSGYPDCRPDYIQSFQEMANLATKAGVTEDVALTIRTPLIDMTKAEIAKAGTDLGVDYSLTISCYDPDETGAACGHCDSCLLRSKGFREAGIPDPTRYQDGL
ncbi:7-cyano-7-deazaguanine synthase [Kordiimonas sediminis]|uniref:7-cyano-7-deazaguanine synthase n=1 Tax=Kordiimonas sediminis TaxID=1735581 RepID=A0A919E765_9PROT|nr:7-cyano-7-deazaguanine synthase QueC [Kordiimonas sediminis]GHF25664.1 7-cyano-7-deazaguanine synthase [Kordiimonas sediminis]